MNIIHVERHDRRNRNAFIKFPFQLYQNTPQWVPHFRMEMRKIFKPSYAFYNYGDAAFLLARDDQGKVLGRLAMANNHRYNNFYGSKTAFFYYFEVVKDPAVAKALFDRGFEWARGTGLGSCFRSKGIHCPGRFWDADQRLRAPASLQPTV